MELSIAHDVLNSVVAKRGMMWEKIEELKKQMSQLNSVATHELGSPQEELMKEYYPLKHHIEGGLYTREILCRKDILQYLLYINNNTLRF